MLEDYEIISHIGKGTYGSVSKVKHIKTSKEYALKKIKLFGTSTYEKGNIINELRILSAHQCPFIVKFKTAFVKYDNIYFVTEYAEKGDLSHIIKESRESSKSLEEHVVWNYFLQTCVAVCYIHELKIIHRDIKPANIFIDSNNNVKLGDFGIIKLMKSFMMYGQTQIGTPIYMCPEMYKRERYDTKVDNWALGCILFEMMFLKPAFDSKNFYDLKKNIFAGNYKMYKSKYSDNMKQLLMKLININPKRRVEIQTILELPTIKHELKIRNLKIPQNSSTLDSFNVKCLIPKNNFEWAQTISSFVDLKSTIELNEEEQNEIEKINVSKKNLASINTITSIESELNVLIKDLDFYKKQIFICEKNIQTLVEEKKTLLKKIIPIPPNFRNI